MNLNFKISELIHSDTSIKHNINNMPDINSLDNMLELICYCLQPLREKIKKPIIITSGYRNSEVNKLVGGVANSQHTKGQAVDFVINRMTVEQIINFIKVNNIEFDQLIGEYNKNSKWVHISYVKNNNRKQVFNLKF